MRLASSFSSSSHSRVLSERNVFSTKWFSCSRRRRKMKMHYPQIILRDVSKLAEDTDGVFLQDASDMAEIRVAINGPVATPYESGVFQLKLLLPDNYPYSPPEVKFITKVFHPNVSRSGRVCMDRLAENWKPTIPLKHVCELTRSLLQEPNPDSPLNVDAARMLVKDPEMYNRTVLLWAKHHAHGIHTYEPYEEMLQVLSALTANIDQALKLLTSCYWNCQAASDRVI